METETKPATGENGALALGDLIEPERVRVVEDAFHVLTVFVDDKPITNVRPVRLFPVSSKADYVGFLDKQGKEVALVARPHRLDRASRETLEHALERMYYVPEILRIDDITESLAVSHWKVLTDRGYASFEVVDREYIRKLPGGRIVIEDADGNRFAIRNVNSLDGRSRDLLESEI